MNFQDWAWPLSREENEEVTRLVGERLADEFLEDMYAVEEDTPGLHKAEGLELLMFYEAQPAQYWIDLLREHPADAQAEFKNWMRLDRKYNPEIQELPLLPELLP